MENKILMVFLFAFVFFLGMWIGAAANAYEQQQEENRRIYENDRHVRYTCELHKPDTKPGVRPIDEYLYHVHKPNTPPTPKPEPDFTPPVMSKPQPQKQIIELHVKYDDDKKQRVKKVICNAEVDVPCSYCDANTSKCKTCRDAGDYRIFYNYVGYKGIDKIGDGNYRKQ